MTCVACQQDTVVGEKCISNPLIDAVIELSVRTRKVIVTRICGLPV